MLDRQGVEDEETHRIDDADHVIALARSRRGAAYGHCLESWSIKYT